MTKNLFGTIAKAGLLLSLIAILPSTGSAGERPLFARADKSTPVLNTPDFRSVFGGGDGRTLKRDASGLIREVEFIALPGTAFVVETSLKVRGATVYRVRTPEYPSPASGLFVDSRFVSVSAKPFPPRMKILPRARQILDRMLSHEGARYVWGGNAPGGIPELLTFYPPAGALSPATKNMWSLRGLDCSGLLYEATGGATPRNTSDLVTFGKPVAVAGLTPGQIAAKLRPLDLIVWKGHVIIVLDEEHTIESCMGCSPRGGVTVRDLRAVLREVMRTRTPENHYPAQTIPSRKTFVVRRWFP
ncbi:MAG TPA: peptidoglycan endopeptidase [Candidatus Omnitrophota bacterium]|nr:peptidoglycan endopeptidase [Candidatus Omnitrophota bacterium]